MPRSSLEEDARKLHDLQPGQTLVYDHRLPTYIDSNDRKCKLPDTFRVVQWNIERGSKLLGITRSLAACNADFIVLQELDINCRRSHYVNVPLELAKALHMQCIFVCEFEELDSEDRSLHNAVGPLSDKKERCEGAVSQGNSQPVQCLAGKPTGPRHFHGNAILSRSADLSKDICVIKHSGSFDWEEHGVQLREPRRGFRSALRVTVNPADRTYPAMPPLYLYCCHFEVFCGALMRVRQLADCLNDAKAILRKAKESEAQNSQGRTAAAGASPKCRAPSFIIAGDLNTMAHGVVRFSPKYARDRLRLLSLGETEAMWLQRKVLARNTAAVIKGCCPLSYRFPAYVVMRVYELFSDNYFVWRLLYGFLPDEVAAMDNTETCFYDPSDKYASITLDNPDYHGFVRGKLDWLLLSNLVPRPFRASRGGARPVDVTSLLEQHSLRAGGSSARYLNRIYHPDQKTLARYPNDESRELKASDAASCTPRDGYVLFNENYLDSDHKGLIMTVKQSGLSASPVETYPSYGAPYTTNVYALGVFLLSRAIPLAVVAATGLAIYERVRKQ